MVSVSVSGGGNGIAEAEEVLTEYERERLENIKRNGQMMASLNIQSRLVEIKRSRQREDKEINNNEKSYKQTQKPKKKKPKAEDEEKDAIVTSVIIRRSLRTRGMPPDSSGLPNSDLNNHFFISPPKPKPKHNTASSPSKHNVTISISMPDAFQGDDLGSHPSLIRRLRTTTNTTKHDHVRVPNPNPIDLGSFTLDPNNIARLLPGKILSVKFLPTTFFTMVIAANKYGNLAFWDVKPQTQHNDNDNDASTSNSNGIYLYRPHSAPISAISVQPFALSKIYTSCYDGLLRMMDIDKEVFHLVHSTTSQYPIYSLSQHPTDSNTLYFAEGQGDFNLFDVREGKVSTSRSLHEQRINSIDFNPSNTNIMATSSTDGLACLWDLRKMDHRNNPESSSAWRTINHGRAVHSAYFSPSGTCLATTSLDDNVGVLQGVNFEDKLMIRHDNRTNRWISSFRAVWGWDDTYLYIGNMKRRVDVLSVTQKKTVYALDSPLMSAIPCRYDAHPFTAGMLAGATSGGQVYLWTSCL